LNIISKVGNSAGGFSEGLMPVEKNGKKGYIDKMGKAVIPLELEYDSIGSFCEGLAGVTIGKNIEIAGSKNESIEEFSKRCKEANKDLRCGFIDKTGKIVIPIEYEGMPCFSEGLAVAVKGGKQSYIDKTGNTPFSTDFDELGNFNEGLAWVKKDGKYGFIDKTGSIIVPIEYNRYDLPYDSPIRFNEGLAVVKKDGKWGILKIETED
jgi:hypothetical protein